MRRNNLLFLVDDDVDDHEIFKSALAQVDGNTQLIIASNGKEALQMLSEQEQLPDYIFVDLNMPRMGGIQLLTEIKKLEALHHIPVIVYSTSSHPDDKGKAMDAGATRFFTKPAKFSELCELLQTILQNNVAG
jgi:CheY-like chemotaxis protein